MQFQVTERITTNASITDVGSVMQSNFRRIATSAVPINNILRVTSIQATFGSINRTDVTDIAIRPVENGYLLVADVKYRPSVAFWIILIITLFTWIFWLIPIIFYIVQKDTVKRAIEEGFRNVKNELGNNQVSTGPNSQSSNAIADLEKLGSLLRQGLVSQQEFDEQKRKLLGLGNTPPPTHAPPPLPAQDIVPNHATATDEAQPNRAFEEARECIKNGQREMAIDILKDIIRRFPDSKAAAQARRSLAPKPKT
jgi:hypothetical protein